MKLALYLPNFRTNITVKEIVDITKCAEELDFDSRSTVLSSRRHRTGKNWSCRLVA